MIRLSALLGCLVLGVTAAAAQDRGFLGFGHNLTNDLIGDGKDRWRAGSYQASWLWGPDWTGALPSRFGALIELRFGGEIVAPERTSRVDLRDRRFGGVLALGLHTHFAHAGIDNSVGLDVAVTGPQTGLDAFQSDFHDVFGGSDISSAVRAAQIDDGVHPTLVVETARRFDLGPAVQVRPYFEGRVGLESLARVGADLTLGQVGRQGLLIREPVAGQRYRGVEGGFRGAAFVLGGDVAYLHDSALLPDNGGVKAEDVRTRLRSGLYWQAEKGVSGFYGLTWLSEEFEAQDEGQLVGTLRLKLDF